MITVATLGAMLTLNVNDFVKGAKDAEGSSDSLKNKLESFGQIAGVGIAAVAGAAVATGVALYNVGSEFDAAYDKIQTGTGATGEALGQLKDSFDQVVAEVPASFDDASTAITTLNQRLGLTGPPLINLSEQFLNLSRITGEDLTTSIQTMTRVFGDWSIKDQSKAMDEMFRASQATGVSMSKLAEEVVQFGAPLRGLGFGFEESVAMMGKWEKEGVNVENVMGAMKKAYGEFSKEFGSKAPEEFRKFVDEVSKAPDAAAAASIAIEKLGVRNGPDFAAAVKEGRFAYGDLVKQITDGSSTINDAADATADFSEKWQLFVNRMKLVVKPIAMEVFNAIGNAMDVIGPKAEEAGQWLAEKLPKAIQTLRDRWEEVRPAVEEAVNKLGGVFATLGDKAKTGLEWLMKPENNDALKAIAFTLGVVLVEAIAGLTIAMWNLAEPVIAVTWPFLLIAAVAGLLAFLFMKLWENSELFRGAVLGLKDVLIDIWNNVLLPLWQFLADKFSTAWDDVKGVFQWFSDNGPTIKATLIEIYELGFKPLVDYLITHQEDLKNIAVAFTAIGLAVLALVGVMLIAAVVIAAVSASMGVAVSLAVVSVAVAISQMIQWFWDLFNNVKTVGEQINQKINDIGDAFNRMRDYVNMVIDSIKGKLWELVSVFISVTSATGSVAEGIKAVFRDLANTVTGIIDGLKDRLWNAGYAAIRGFADGVTAGLGPAKSLVQGAMAGIRALLPGSPAKEGPFSGRGWVSYAGESVSRDFAKGIKSGESDVKAALATVMESAHSRFEVAPANSGAFVPLAASAAANAREQNVSVNFGGNTADAFASAFMQLVRTGKIQISSSQIRSI